MVFDVNSYIRFKSSESFVDPNQHSSQSDSGNFLFYNESTSGYGDSSKSLINFVYYTSEKLPFGSSGIFNYTTGINKHVLNVSQKVPLSGGHIKGILILNNSTGNVQDIFVTPTGSGLNRVIGSTSGGYYLPPSGFVGWFGGYDEAVSVTGLNRIIIKDIVGSGSNYQMINTFYTGLRQPYEIKGLRAYWDANTAVTVGSGEAINEWSDKISNNLVSIKSGTIIFNAPTGSVHDMNGHRAVVWPNTNNNMALGTHSFVDVGVSPRSGDAFLLFALFKPHTTGETQVIAAYSSGAIGFVNANFRGWNCMFSGSRPQFAMKGASGTGLPISATVTTSGSIVAEQPVVYMVNRSLNHERLTLSLNGNDSGTVPVGSGFSFVPGGGHLQFGGNRDASNDSRSSISDLIIYNRPIDFTAEEINNIGIFLANKVGTTWRNIHAYNPHATGSGVR